MIIFEYRITPAYLSPKQETPIFDITIKDTKENNVTTAFYGKKYQYTLPPEAIAKIKKIINEKPELFKIKALEPNSVLDGEEYFFTFSDGENSASFSGFNILDYGRKPRKNATLALRTARTIKDQVLLNYHIKTKIPNRLQHWPSSTPRPPIIHI